jgi:prepilin-type processing-associated H-X9-DG protein
VSKRKVKKMKSKSSFSKKDLIVSFVCIVFVLATLGSAGSTGRRRAKEALCLSNLRQWGTVFLAFTEDNEGYFMEGWTNQQVPGPVYKRYWMEALRPYYKNPDLRCCPEATKTWWNADGSTGPGIDGGTFSAWGIFPSQDQCGEVSSWWEWVVACDYGSYGINAWVHNIDVDQTWGISNNDIHWRTPDVNGAENVPMFGGHQWLDAWPNYLDSPPEYDGQPWSQGSQMGRFCMNRHNGFVNWAFLDGSARKVGIKELWTLKWHRMFVTDGPWTIGGGVIPGDWPDWMQDFEGY